MDKLRIYILKIIFFLTIFFLGSCIHQSSQLESLYCPKPVQNCFPESWTGESLDTNSDKLGTYVYRISKVKNINTSNNEWQLSSFNKEIFLTYSDLDANRSISTKINSVDNLTIKKGISLPVEKHFGSINGNKRKIVLAISNLSNQNQEKVPIEESTGYSRLYSAVFEDNNIYNLSKIVFDEKSDEWYGHPYLHPRGDILFFSSDRSGGYGGNDIWFTYLANDGTWSSPINCGAGINTQCDEISPFIGYDGNDLLFSSSGHQTVGGYDLFKSKINSDFLTNYTDTSKAVSFFDKIDNLGSPINTKYDELFPYSNTNTDSVLYYSSNQNGDNFDIYVFYKEFIPSKAIVKSGSKNEKIIMDTAIIAQKIIIEKIKLKGKVLDQFTLTPIDSARINIIQLPEFQKELPVYSDSIGEFSTLINIGTDYQITAHKDEFFYDTKNVTVDSIETNPEVIFYLPRKGEIRVNFPLDEFKTPYKYTLDSNGTETGRLWQNELNMVAENINLSIDRIDKVILVGHTDDIGTEVYNYNLGERRVDFIINELVKRGISRNKLFGRSAGELELLTRKANESLDNYRKRLRRVTIEKILNK